MIRVIDKKKYTQVETTQYEAVRAAYRQHVCEELPHFFRWAPKDNQPDAQVGYPESQSQVSDFKVTRWQHQLGAESLGSYAESIIIMLVEYQESRFKSHWSVSGYLNDPCNLVCEELKDWASRVLSRAPCSDEFRKEVQKRVDYLLNLVTSEQFGDISDTLKTKPLECTLLEVCDQLRHGVIQKIDRTLAASSAREHLTVLCDSLQRALQHGAYVLLFVFRCTTPPRYTFDDLREIINKHEAPTLCDTLLFSLLRGRAYEQAMGASLSSMRPSQESILDCNNPFYDGAGSPCVPMYLLSASMLDEASRSSSSRSSLSSSSCDELDLGESGSDSDTSSELIAADKNGSRYIESTTLNAQQKMQVDFFKSRGSGMADLFSGDFRAIESFLRLHAEFNDLANVLSLVQQARNLAGDGGDVLMYGVVRGQLLAVISMYKTLEDAIQASLQSLEAIATEGFKRLVEIRRDPDTIPLNGATKETQRKIQNRHKRNKHRIPRLMTWKRNYVDFINQCLVLQNDLKAANQAAARARESADAFLEKGGRLDHLSDNISCFKDSTLTLCERLVQNGYRVSRSPLDSSSSSSSSYPSSLASASMPSFLPSSTSSSSSGNFASFIPNTQSQTFGRPTTSSMRYNSSRRASEN